MFAPPTPNIETTQPSMMTIFLFYCYHADNSRKEYQIRRVEDFSMIAECYKHYLENKRSSTDFEELLSAADDLDSYLMTQGLSADVIDEIRSKSLEIGTSYEQQGFFYGMSKGLALAEEAKHLIERK